MCTNIIIMYTPRKNKTSCDPLTHVFFHRFHAYINIVCSTKLVYDFHPLLITHDKADVRSHTDKLADNRLPRWGVIYLYISHTFSLVQLLYFLGWGFYILFMRDLGALSIQNHISLSLSCYLIYSNVFLIWEHWSRALWEGRNCKYLSVANMSQGLFFCILSYIE